jgi:hypothetical protein
MPKFEQQQMQQGQPIDMLEPPRDPLRLTPGKGLLWEKSPTDFNQAHTGFDIDSVSKFDTYKDNWEQESQRSDAAAEAAVAEEPKSWWKPWK